MSGETAARFRRMHARIESLPDTSTRPTPTLDVVRHGHEENYWNRLLTYFLTPTESHQLETAGLEAFLSAVEDQHSDFDFSRLGFEDIAVRSEVGTGNGIADLIVHVKGEWFLWVEMKVRAGEHEGQTTGYVGEPTLGGSLEKNDFPDTGRHYVFLADDGETADAPAFETVSWQSVVRSFEGLLDKYGQFPMQSLAQLNDFCETIRNEMGMSNEKENRNDLAALAVEYGDEIDRVDDALESYSDELRERWAEQLDELWGREPTWVTNTNGQYADMYRQEWHLTPEENPDAYANDSRLHLRLQHEISPEKLKRGFVQVKFQVTGTDNSIIDNFYARLHQPEIADAVRATTNNISDQSGKDADFYTQSDRVYKRIVDAERDYELDGRNDYVSALRTALDDLQPIIEIVDKTYRESVLNDPGNEPGDQRT